VGSGNDLDRLRQRGLHLVYATVAWNAVEGVTALVAGLLAHSVALTAFGLDSSIEVVVSLVAVWQMKAETRFRSRVALQLIGVSFLAVSLYVGFEAIRRIASGQHAELSMIGIAVTSAAVPTMAVLGFAKRRVASRVSNAVLAAEARFSLVLLVSLLGRVSFGEADAHFVYGGLGAGGVFLGVSPGQTTLERAVGALAGVAIPITTQLRLRTEVRYLLTHDVDPKPGRGTATEISGHRGENPGRALFGPHFDTQFVPVLVGLDYVF